MGVLLGPVLVAGHSVALRGTRLSDFEPWRELRLRDREFIEPYWTTSALSWDERHTRAWWIRERLRQRRARAAGRALPLSVLVDGEFAGQITLAPIDTRNRAAEMGIWMDSGRARHGVGTVAGALITDYAFGELGLHRITAPVCVGNRPARQSCLRGGMSLEATMIRALSVGGQQRDHELWAVTADLWPSGGYVDAFIAAGLATGRISPESGAAGTSFGRWWRATAPGEVIAAAARYYLGMPLRATGGRPALPRALDGHDADDQIIALRKQRSRLVFRRSPEVRYAVISSGHPIGDVIVDASGIHPRLTLQLSPSPAHTKAAVAGLQLLIDYAWDRMRLDRLEALIDPDAEHLTAVAAAAGMRREGLLTGARIDPDGRFHDVELWAAINEKPSRTSTPG